MQSVSVYLCWCKFLEILRNLNPQLREERGFCKVLLHSASWKLWTSLRNFAPRGTTSEVTWRPGCLLVFYTNYWTVRTENLQQQKCLAHANCSKVSHEMEMEFPFFFPLHFLLPGRECWKHLIVESARHISKFMELDSINISCHLNLH